MDLWVVEVLRWSYRIPFCAVPTLSEEPIPFPSYGPSSIRGKALESEVLSLVKKGAAELAPLPSPGFYSQLFVVIKAGHRAIASESEGAQNTLQDGDSPVCFSLGSARGLDGDSKLEGCLLAGSKSSGQPQVPQIRCFWPGVPVQGAVLWSLHGSSGLCQSHGSGFDLSTPCRYPYPPLPGRLADPGGLTLSGFDSVGCGSPIVPFSRDRRQLREVLSGACAADDISWRSSGLGVFLELLGILSSLDSSGSRRSTQDALPSTSSSFLGPPQPISSGAVGLGMSTRPRGVVGPVSSGRGSVSFSSDFWSDASDLGWGAHLGDDVVSGRWSPQDADLSINARELLAVERGLHHFAPQVVNSTVASVCGQFYCCYLPAQSRGNSVSSLERYCAANPPVSSL